MARLPRRYVRLSRLADIQTRRHVSVVVRMNPLLYTATLAAALLPSTTPLRVILPDGTELSAQRVDVHPDAQTVVIYEAPLFADGFE